MTKERMIKQWSIRARRLLNVKEHMSNTSEIEVRVWAISQAGASRKADQLLGERHSEPKKINHEKD